MNKARYCQPLDAGSESTDRTVGKYLARLLDSLDYINSSRVRGQVLTDCLELREKVFWSLKNEGWRITVKANDNWQVLPPNKESLKKLKSSEQVVSTS